MFQRQIETSERERGGREMGGEGRPERERAKVVKNFARNFFSRQAECVGGNKKNKSWKKRSNCCFKNQF